MFAIEQKSINGFKVTQLIDKNNGTSAGIIPANGAMLYSYQINKDGATVNVIDSYSNKAEFENELERKGFRGSKLSPFVCRLNEGKFHFGEKNYTIQKFYLEKNAIHGLIYDAAFTITSQQAAETYAEVTMEYNYEATDAGFPFLYKCIVKYKLEKDNSLTIATTIENKDAGMIPIADGWHPYFTFGGRIDDCQLEFQSKEMVEFDEFLVPTGKLIPYQEFGSLKNINDQFFDNCFTVNFAECQPMLVFRDPDQQLQIEIKPAETYPYLQIYTPPHRKSIAIENLSAAPDAFNNGMGLKTLSPGEGVTFHTTYIIKNIGGSHVG